jgi:hypothetical protein
MNDESGADRTPPRVATWLVRKLCVQERLEDIEGDLLELHDRRMHNSGDAHARAHYVRDALSACLRHSRITHWAANVGRGGTLEFHASGLMALGMLLLVLAVIGLVTFAFSRSWLTAGMVCYGLLELLGLAGWSGSGRVSRRKP